VASDLAIGLGQVRAEQKAFWRNPASALFGFAFPIMFLLIFGTIFRGTNACVDGTFGSRGQCVGGSLVPYNSFFVPAMAAWGVITTCFVNLAMAMSIRRDNGLLKRIRGTPLPSAAFVAGVVGSALITGVLVVALTAVVGHLLYAAPWPAHWLAAVVTVVAGGVAFCVLGIAVTAAIPNADAAPAVVNFSYLPVLFISGFFFSFSNAALNDLAEVFPIYWFKEAMFTAFGVEASSGGWNGRALLIVLGWAVAGLVVALRFFRWEPRKT
jgi:ABC-2 type transport system permease protein